MKTPLIKPSTFLSVIIACAGIVFLLILPDLIRAVGTDAFDYIFAVECLALCLMAVMAYLYNLQYKSND